MSSIFNTEDTNASLSVASTPQPLVSTRIEVWSCIITASPSNSDTVWIGGPAIDESSEVGHWLNPGDSISIDGAELGAGYEPFNLADIYFDSATVDQEISISYLKSDRTARTLS